MVIWILLLFFATALSCQPPIPQAAFSQSYQPNSPEVSYHQQATEQTEYSQSNSPFPGYQQPPSPSDDLVPLTRALSAPLAAVGLTKAPLENIPPPVDLEALKMAGKCSEIKSLNEFEDCVQVSLLPRQSPDAWHCTFEEGTACKFQAITSGFSVGRLPTSTAYSSFAQMSSRHDFDSPQGQFLYVVSSQGLRAYEELIVSARIPCQQGDGELKLSYWLSPPEGTIRVCTLDDEMRSCTQPFVHTNQSGVIVAVINPIKPKSQATSFEVEIVASNLVHPSIFAIDNIEYKADFCEPKVIPIANREQDAQFFEAEDTLDAPMGDIRRTPARIPKRPEIEAESKILSEKMDEALGAEIDAMSDELMQTEEIESPEKVNEISPPVFHRQTKAPIGMRLPSSKNPCNVLRCHFEENFCGWHNLGGEANYGEWRYRGYKKTAATRESQEFEELEDDAGIAIAGSDSTPSPLYRKIAFLLESPEFLALSNLTMLYDVKRQNDDLTLQVCFDSPNYCPYKLSPYRKEAGWQIDQNLTIPEGTRRVYFLAIQWKRYSRLLIDNIRIVGC